MLKVNTNYFDNIETEAQAYLLGYLLADGHITKDKLCVRSIDKYFIELIKRELKSEHKISCNNNVQGYNNAKSQYSISIARKNNWTNLYAYKKDSNNLTIPNLKPELVRHFVRGFFDGDGSVYHWINQGKTLKKYSYYNTKAGRVKKLLPEEQWKVQEYAMLRGECSIIACDSMIKELSTLYTTLDINHRFKKSTSDLVSYIVVTNKKDITKLYNYIYKDANYYLQRKKDKFEEILNNVGVIVKLTVMLTPNEDGSISEWHLALLIKYKEAYATHLGIINLDSYSLYNILRNNREKVLYIPMCLESGEILHILHDNL